MKTLMITLAAAASLLMLPADDASAHGGRYLGPYFSFGIGLGLPYYRPYYPYYPRSYVGVSMWPRPLTTRVRTREREVEGAHQLYVYPAAGQSEGQLAEDRYECHQWSVEQTQFDPSRGAGSRTQADDYARAMTACLEARSYVVR